MQIRVHHYSGDRLPEAFSQLFVTEIWVVAHGEYWVAVFFSREDANSYAAWYQARLDHEMTSEMEPEPENEPAPKPELTDPLKLGKSSTLKFR